MDSRLIDSKSRNHEMATSNERREAGQIEIKEWYEALFSEGPNLCFFFLSPRRHLNCML